MSRGSREQGVPVGEGFTIECLGPILLAAQQCPGGLLVEIRLSTPGRGSGMHRYVGGREGIRRTHGKEGKAEPEATEGAKKE